VILLIALAASTAALYGADPAVLNGSFEDPMNPPSGFQTGGGTSWTPMGSNVFILSNSFGGPQTMFGDQYLGIAMGGSSDQQTIPGFLTGQSYVLDLFIANIFGSLNPKLTVTITGAATAAATFAATDSFSEVQLPFSATSNGNITLSLIDAGSNIAVDNVTVAAAPEPSTVFAMLLLSGTLTLGAIRRGRLRVA
jgi:hypothetical protein